MLLAYRHLPSRTYSQDICSKNEIIVYIYENTYIKVEKKNVHFSNIMEIQIKTTLYCVILPIIFLNN